MKIEAIELIVSYYRTICGKLPIGGYGIKVLHDALDEIAALKSGAQPQADNISFVKIKCTNTGNCTCSLKCKTISSRSPCKKYMSKKNWKEFVKSNKV